MKQNQVGISPFKRRYSRPSIDLVITPEEDVVRTSGQMGWGTNWGDGGEWTPGRDNTFFGVGIVGGNQ